MLEKKTCLLVGQEDMKKIAHWKEVFTLDEVDTHVGFPGRVMFCMCPDQK